MRAGGFTRRAFGAAAGASFAFASAVRAEEHADPIKVVDIGDGIALHYVDLGKGEPIVFVHGSLSDLSYWRDPARSLADRYRTIPYSRRYNPPNQNPARPGYSALTDAHDLGRVIETLKLGRAHVVGHSHRRPHRAPSRLSATGTAPQPHAVRAAGDPAARPPARA